MKALWTRHGLASLVAAILLCDLALAQQHPDDFRRSMGNLRPSHRTAFPATQGSPPPGASQHRRSRQIYVYQPYFPAYNYNYGYYYPPVQYYRAYPFGYVPRYWQYRY